MAFTDFFTSMMSFTTKLRFVASWLTSAAAFSLMHGANDAQKTMGIITLALFTGTAAEVTPIREVDGRQIGATLDRNGLRPARFILTDDDQVIMASESGVLPIAENKIVRKWRLQPGKMLLVDLDLGKIIDDLREAGQKNILNQAAVKEILERIDELKAEAASLEEEVEKIRTEEAPQEEHNSEEKPD